MDSIQTKRGWYTRNTPTSVGKISQAYAGLDQQAEHPHQRGEDAVCILFVDVAITEHPHQRGEDQQNTIELEQSLAEHPHQRGEDDKATEAAKALTAEHPHQRGEDSLYSHRDS